MSRLLFFLLKLFNSVQFLFFNLFTSVSVFGQFFVKQEKSHKKQELPVCLRTFVLQSDVWFGVSSAESE